MLQCRSCSRRVASQIISFPRHQGLSIVARSASTLQGREHLSASTRTDKAVTTIRPSLGDRSKQKNEISKPVFGNDPLQLAEQVRGLLRKDKFDDAEEVVRLASKHGDQFTVSWNHLIDWKMSRGKVNGAMKIFQDVCISTTCSDILLTMCTR